MMLAICVLALADDYFPCIHARFRRIHAGDQGAHCRPWTPASLFCCWRKESLSRDASLSQNKPPRFHLNCEPRQLHSSDLELPTTVSP